MYKIKLNNGKEISVEEGKTLRDLIKENNLKEKYPIVLGILNDKIYEMNSKIDKDGKLILVDIGTNMGMRTYVRTLQFVLIKAVYDIFPEAKVSIEHSLSKGLYCEIDRKNKELTEDELILIKNKMKDIIQRNIPIEKVSVSKEQAIEIFEKYRMKDKVRLLKSIDLKDITLYKLDDRYDYFYGTMGYATGLVKLFDLLYYKPGFILRYPTNKNPNVLPKFIEHKKLFKIFRETERWGNILDLADVGALNNKIDNKEILDLISISEALHEKKIAYIADMISERKDTKIVLIAGPSSSGKTTFARRLAIQLRVNGLKPIPLSMDDYFVDRDKNVKNEKGEYDFESIHALDLKLLNEHLTNILSGKEIEIPTYNFKKGKREWSGNRIKLPENGILILEGIHGLNDALTSSIDKKNKFKIYISALTQLNIDEHNRIATTDVRMIRRVVRDYLSRGYVAEETLKMWESIKRGEEENIFVFQENADVMFNSTLVYELCVLKKFAINQLSKIPLESEVYYEAERLKSFLKFFKEIPAKHVPSNSILREFIGGSCFYKY